MTYFAITCSAVLGVATLYQLIQVVMYVRAIRTPAPKLFENSHLPKFAVMMPLRGADPFLSQAISSVLDQDYPDFQLYFVIDHPSDPALDIVQKIIKERGSENIHVSFIEHRHESCSLLCNAVQQFASEVDEPTELVLICAADVVIPRNWLKLAAIAMQDPKIGATLGNRWYMPRVGKLGSLVRYVWNSAANISMWRYQGIWSGAMALRVRDIQRLNLGDVWMKSFSEDMTVVQPLLDAGLKLKHVPQLIAVNREEISVSGNFHFIKRQFFITRFHHPDGLQMVCDSIPLSVASLATMGAFIASIILNNNLAAAWTGATMAASFTSLAASLILMEYYIRRIIKQRGEETTPVSLSMILLFPLAYVICQIQYLCAIPSALLNRRIVWRGITYDVSIRHKKIQMLNYEPYCPPEISEEHPVSI